MSNEIKFPLYEETDTFAVRFHKGTPEVPDGWPKELVLLAPALPEIPANKENGFPGSPKKEKQDMRLILVLHGYSEEAISSFREVTGRELNEIMKKLASDHREFILARLAREEKERSVEASDLATQGEIRDGFEWDGKKLSLSSAAQMNLLRKAQLVGSWLAGGRKAEDSPFPILVSTSDHGAINVMTEIAFQKLLRAADLHIDTALARGRSQKLYGSRDAGPIE